MNRKALGKGINALIPDFEMGVPESHANGPAKNTELLIDEISPNRFQPRKYFDDDKLEELVTSIRDNGVLQPIVVQKVEAGYELVVGERRWRASKKAGLKKIPAVIREVTDAQALELAIIENIHRQDLNHIEDEYTYDRLAEELISGKISMGHARALLGLDNAGQMEALRKEIFKQDLTVRQIESRVSRLKQSVSKKPVSLVSKKNIFIKDLEKEFERRLGTKVDIKSAKKGGKLVVTYYSDDDLDRIKDLIGQSKR